MPTVLACCVYFMSTFLQALKVQLKSHLVIPFCGQKLLNFFLNILLIVGNTLFEGMCVSLT